MNTNQEKEIPHQLRRLTFLISLIFTFSGFVAAVTAYILINEYLTQEQPYITPAIKQFAFVVSFQAAA